MLKRPPMKVAGYLTIICLVSTAVVGGLVLYFGFSGLNRAYDPVDIRVAVTSWPAARLLYAANVKDFFAGRGIHVALVDVGENSGAVTEAMIRGQADVGIVSMGGAAMVAGSHVPISVVMGVDESSGAHGIVVSSDIVSVSDLRGRRIAVSPDGASGRLLQQALARAGLTLGDVVVVTEEPFNAVRSFLTHDVDGLAVAEPELHQAISRSQSHLLFSSSQTEGLLPDVLAVRQEFLALHHQEVTSFVGAWFDLVKYLRFNPDNRKELLAVVAMKSGYSLADVEEQFQEIHLFGEQENLQAFAPGQENTSLSANMLQAVSFVGEVYPEFKTVDAQMKIDSTFVQAARAK